MQIKPFYDQATFTLTYVVYDEATRDAVVIDPVLDFDPASGRLTRSAADEVMAFIRTTGLRVHLLLETHAHADHLSASQVLKSEWPDARLAIGENIRKVQATFKSVYNLGADFKTDGSQFDRLLRDRERVSAGTLSFDVYFTPGHTPACASYDFGGHVFTGDALFMPDYGVGRTDFPGGSAAALYESVTACLYRLPDATRVFTAHDYRPGGRDLRYESTIGEEKRSNIQLRVDTPRDAFMKMRMERDATLAAPRLLHPSVQVNIDGGRFPRPESNGVAYMKIPLSGPGMELAGYSRTFKM